MIYKNILLIDDDSDDQATFQAALENIAAKVECNILSNAKDALKKLIKKELIPDLIFLDLNMPMMNGSEFLKEIKQIDELKAIPVIVLSTSSDVDIIEETRKLGAFFFVTKPNKFNDLVKILESFLG